MEKKAVLEESQDMWGVEGEEGHAAGRESSQQPLQLRPQPPFMGHTLKLPDQPVLGKSKCTVIMN